MKSLPLLLLICFSVNLSAQNKFTRFVEGKRITWATEFTDTLHFSNPNLSELLRTQFYEGKIKAALVENSQTMQPVIFQSLPEVLQRMRPNAEIENNSLRDSLFSSSAFDERTRDMVEVRDIIYLEKGKLRSQVYTVSPKYLVQTSWGMVLGVSNLFTTAFNDKRSPSKSVLKKAMPVGGSSRRIVLDEEAGYSLKQLYGQNLLDAIWNDLDGKNYEIYRLDSNKRISLRDISAGLIRVPVYDETGKIARSVDGPLSPESFHSVDIVQNWSYNKEKNLLFGTISHLLLNLKNGTSENEMLQPLLKIVVKQ